MTVRGRETVAWWETGASIEAIAAARTSRYSTSEERGAADAHANEVSAAVAERIKRT